MEEFIPNGVDTGGNTLMPVEVRASMELVKVTQDARMLGVIQAATRLAQLRQFGKIETQEQYDQAIDAFSAVKEALKTAEFIRHEYVDFPTTVVKLTNDFFRSVKDNLESTKAHLSQIIQAKKSADEAAAKRATEELAGMGPVVKTGSDGVTTVEIEPNIEIPKNVVMSAKGAKVHTRRDTVVKVVDLRAFLKAAMSKSTRNIWLNEGIEELVEVKVGVLKRLIIENKRSKVPGVVVEVEEKAV